jgi:ankyrin repeat protein
MRKTPACLISILLGWLGYSKRVWCINLSNIQPFHDCSYFAKIDPLIHIAVKDEEVLELLWNYNQTIDLSDDRRFALDFVLDVDAPNFFNKTPLMTSAQFDLIKSAEFLISKGASVGLKTEEEWNRLEHDQRTALMYAAANASLEMISLLLNHGADVSAKDSKGLRAVDYLLGRGPVPANPKLQEEDLKLAIALLE